MTAGGELASHKGVSRSVWGRYREHYSRLPSGVQMIGLQLWLPLVFVIAFCLCYVGAFHSPTPRQVPVAIVGSSSDTAQFAEQLQSSSHGALRVSVQPSAEVARHKVRTGTLAAAYVPGPRAAQLIIASSNQYQLASLTSTVFGPVAAAEHLPLSTLDLAPLPKRDSFGTSLFYTMLAWSIGGYMSGMFVGLMGVGLSHRYRLGIIVAANLMLSLITTIMVRFAVGAVDGHFWALWGIGAATAITVGLVVNGLSYVLHRYVIGAALIIFVFLNVPASGGAYPTQFVPQPFRALHTVAPGTGTLDLARSVVYNVGPGAGHGALIIACYAAAGLILTLAGRPYFTALAAWRTRRGAPPGMMIAAQLSALRAHSAAHGHHEATDPDDADLSPAERQARLTRDENDVLTSEYTADEADAAAAAAITGAE